MKTLTFHLLLISIIFSGCISYVKYEIAPARYRCYSNDIDNRVSVKDFAHYYATCCSIPPCRGIDCVYKKIITNKAKLNELNICKKNLTLQKLSKKQFMIANGIEQQNCDITKFINCSNKITYKKGFKTNIFYFSHNVCTLSDIYNYPQIFTILYNNKIYISDPLYLYSLYNKVWQDTTDNENRKNDTLPDIFDENK